MWDFNCLILNLAIFLELDIYLLVLSSFLQVELKVCFLLLSNLIMGYLERYRGHQKHENKKEI